MVKLRCKWGSFGGPSASATEAALELELWPARVMSLVDFELCVSNAMGLVGVGLWRCAALRPLVPV